MSDRAIVRLAVEPFQEVFQKYEVISTDEELASLIGCVVALCEV